ncbi:MAG: serine/threonine protein kinase [Lachnospiraceae bacterium]|nr:serine/threonine protein kinase [Lachnospiraceae bacterium]
MKDWTSKYRVVQTLKENGTTGVYLAEHVRLKRLCVIKTLNTRKAGGDAILKEALSLKQLAHPGIPKIYDIEEGKEGFCIVEEYIQGESLTSYCLSKNPEKEEIIEFMLQLCGLLKYLHGRTPPMLHLDLKPDNLLVNGGKLYLIDFGSALHKKADGKREALTGTPGYAAPECYRGEADVRSDIYSAGKLLDFMVSGSRKRELKRGEFKKLLAIASKACRDKPADRYRSADAMEKVLKALKHKNAKHSAAKKAICVVGLAGSGRRMGVTYFSLACAAYATGHGERALYLECNESAMAEQVAEKAGKEEGDGVFLYHGVHMAECRAVPKKAGMAGYSVEEETKYYGDCGYSVILADFGVLTTENLQGFSSSDLCLFFAGEKDWELENTWRGLTRLAGLEEKLIMILFGSSKRRYHAFSKRLPGIVCRRMPFMNGMEAASEKEVMHRLLAEVFERAM